MSHTAKIDVHPQIVLVELLDDVEIDDILLTDLPYDEEQPLYMLLDGKNVRNGTPEGFLKAIKNSPMAQGKLTHIGVYMPNPVMKIAATMISKVSKMRNKVSFHKSVEEARSHLLELIEQSEQQ